MHSIHYILPLALSILAGAATAIEVSKRNYDCGLYNATYVVYNDEACTQGATTITGVYCNCDDFPTTGVKSLQLLSTGIQSDSCGIVVYPVEGCANEGNEFWGPFTALNTCYNVYENAGNAEVYGGEFTCVN